jgi:oligopeptide/dipeptide ABC transporter ATP-binding protein
LIDRLRRELDMALVLISHDLGVVAGVADQIAIMYAGRIVEAAQAEELFARPVHPYASALLAAKPRLDRPADTALRPIPGLPPDPARPVGVSRTAPRRCRRSSRSARPAILPRAGVGPSNSVSSKPA